MERGFVFHKHPSGPPDLFNYVWFNAMIGKTNVLDRTSYNALPVWKRGLIHTPSLKGANIQENGSFFKELLDQLQVSSVNLGAPVLIDMFEGDVAYRINGKLDLVSEYVGYIRDHWMTTGLEKKPLLRLNQGQWQAYCTDNLSTTQKLLEIVDILVCAPGCAMPPEWTYLSKVKWFEYFDGLIASETSGIWLESPSSSSGNIPPVNDDPPPNNNPPPNNDLPIITSMTFPTRTTVKGKFGWLGNVDLEIENFFD